MKRTSLTALGMASIWLLPAAFGQVGQGGQYAISTFAGGGPANGVAATSVALSALPSVAVDTLGNLYVAANGQNRIYKVATNGTIGAIAGNGAQGYSADNGPAASAQLNAPLGVAVDGSGNVYIADTGNARIRKVANG